MAWYSRGGWDYYPPYVSVAEKKANGARALAKVLKKSKRTADPVLIAHRKRQFTTTFWGKAWADNLERYADLANRLPRGCTYLRNGSVLDLAIARGRAEAYVAGSELYRVTIGIADDRLSAVFGIELEAAPPVGARRADRPSRRDKRRRSLRRRGR